MDTKTKKQVESNNKTVNIDTVIRINDSVTIILADCMDALPGLRAHSIVTDPPGGISFMGKAWDTDHGGRDKWIATYAEIARLAIGCLPPGGHALVWALPRTSHWTATAWEDGGFEVRDRVAHVFGSGFSKSMNVMKAVMALESRGSCSMSDQRKAAMGDRYEPLEAVGHTRTGSERALNCKRTSPPDITAPATDAAKQWDGWGTALKPAMEDWWLLRKPLDGTIAGNVLKHGVGGLNIDGCRVGTEKTVTKAKKGMYGAGSAEKMREQGFRPYHIDNRNQAEKVNPPGRWPAHLVHDGSDEVVALFPSPHGAGSKKPAGGWDSDGGWGFIGKGEYGEARYGDTGSAARFFKCCPPDPLDDPDARRFLYCAKPSKRERDAGLDNTCTVKYSVGSSKKGELSCAVSPMLSEISDAANWKPATNFHATVKPVSLMRWLIRFITPPSGIVLDPFMGSGSTGIAAIREGIAFIGIEKDPESFEIARARLEHELKQKRF